MQNPQNLRSSLQKSTKALEKPIIQKFRQNKYNLKLSETLKTRKSIQLIKKSELPQSPRSISTFLQQQSLNQHYGSNKNLSKHRKHQSFFQKAFQSNYSTLDISQSSVYSPKRNQEKALMNLTLRRFSEFEARKTMQNNSPRKQTIPGAEEVFDSTKLMSITMRNMRTLQPSLKPKQTKQKVRLQFNRSLNLPQIYRVQKQTKLQKEKFYKMHPYFLKKEDAKSLQRRSDKRKNLIGLQQAFIRLRNRQTSKIYCRK